MRLAAALCLLAAPALAQPAEAPPDGFAAQVFVDSEGCVFHRAALAGRTVWAQRLDADGAPVCGRAPSVAQAPAAALPRIPPARAGAEPDFPAPGVYVQLGAFTAESTADRIARNLQARGYTLLRQDFPRVFVLFAGPFESMEPARAARRDLRARGFPDAFLRRADGSGG